MKYIFRSLLFIFPFLIHCTSILVTDEARRALDQLAAIPEHQSLRVIIDDKPLRVFFSPWHNVTETAAAFASTVLFATGGRGVGSGCSDGNATCLRLLFERAILGRLRCCRDGYGRVPPTLQSSLPSTTAVTSLSGKFFEATEPQPQREPSVWTECVERAAEAEAEAEKDHQRAAAAAAKTLSACGPTMRPPLRRGKSVKKRRSGFASLGAFLESLALERFLGAFEAEQIGLEELPLLSERLLREAMGLPLGPALRLLRAVRGWSDGDSSSDSSSSSSRSSSLRAGMWPVGLEGTDWAKVPCVPPYCWHRCSPRPRSLPAGSSPSEEEEEEESLADALDELYERPHEERAEDDPFWRPQPRWCPRIDGSGGWIHPIGISVPAPRVVGCVPWKSRDAAEEVTLGTAFSDEANRHGQSARKEAFPEKHDPFEMGDPSDQLEEHQGEKEREGLRLYDFGPREEHAYHAAYRGARFALTRKKAGWDCMRHVEILAAGAVPLFVDPTTTTTTTTTTNGRGGKSGVHHGAGTGAGLEHVPAGTMGLLPKKMMREALSLPGVSVVNGNRIVVDRAAFNESAYLDLAWRMLHFTRRHLTTAAVAQYVLRVTGHLQLARRRRGASAPPSGSDGLHVLVLGSSREEDYIRDLFVHGLRALAHWQQGEQKGSLIATVLDAVRPAHMYLPVSEATCESPEGAADTGGIGSESGNGGHSDADPDYSEKLYGHGFSYSRWIPDDDHLRSLGGAEAGTHAESNLAHCNNRSRVGVIEAAQPTSLRERILRHDFDLVVYGSVHRGLPFWSEVQSSYTKRDIVFLDGEDAHFGGWGASVARLVDKGHYFMREMPDGCPFYEAFSAH